MAKEVDQVLDEDAGEDENEAHGCQSPGGGVLQRAVWGWTCSSFFHGHGGGGYCLVPGGTWIGIEGGRLI